MQRSSESIAQLACALAKAQIELTNPEKTLEATIDPDRRGQEARTFKYASLASGLDIVRKTLGQHEIATVQATAIDAPSQIVTLTTVLAHSSGEWIASDWPVCGVAETATPHRMGAALTYARRYGLFTLVGIAGEDDVDAPQSPERQSAETPPPAGRQNGRLNGGERHAVQPSPRRQNTPLAKPDMPTPLRAKTSAELRDWLLGAIKDIASADDAALWAYCNLGAKNGLAAADAQCVEEAFRAALATVAQSAEKPKKPSPVRDASRNRRQRSKAIDKSVLALPEPRRIRDREHVKSVAKRPCLICGRQPSDAHHLRYTQSRAMGRKVSDEFTVPLCRGHHREVHRCGDEAAWWAKVGIEPTTAARALWLKTHPLPVAILRSAGCVPP